VEQRTRWEHGHLSLIFSEAPRLFWDSLTRLNGGLLALALDVTVRPLALLTVLVVAAWIASCFIYLITKARFPIAITCIMAGLHAFSIFFAWARYGRLGSECSIKAHHVQFYHLIGRELFVACFIHPLIRSAYRQYATRNSGIDGVNISGALDDCTLGALVMMATGSLSTSAKTLARTLASLCSAYTAAISPQTSRKHRHILSAQSLAKAVPRENWRILRKRRLPLARLSA
jgi:hypothetical protein